MFKDVSVSSSGSHFVSQIGTLWANLVEDMMIG